MEQFKFFAFFVLATFVLGVSITEAQIQSKPVTLQTTNTTSAFNLPFVEDWESHSFATNQWSISDDAWIVDVYHGNDGASAKFKGSSNQTNYSSTLTSNPLAGSLLYVGTITLNFDLKLDDLSNNGSEYLFIKLFDGTNYITLDSINNNGSFDWETLSYSIADYVYGKDFQIVFEASGVSSVNISGWYIDNIEVTRTCEPPYNLDGKMVWYWYDSVAISVEWNAPAILNPPDPIKHWDSGENYTGVGTYGDYSIAARWDANTLNDVDGDSITKLRFFVSDSLFDYIVLHVWTGEDAANTVYTDTITNPVPGMWHDHTLDQPVVIDASQEYWIGYDIINQAPNGFPAGADQGPAIPGYGDLINTGTEWDNLSDFGLNFNWNIEMYVDIPPANDSSGLNNFVVYRSLDGVDYSPIDTVDYNYGQMEYAFEDYDIIYQHYYFYKVNAVWGKNGDTCTSAYAKSWDQFHDYIMVYYGDIYIDETSSNNLSIYPNPATNSITIKSAAYVEEVSIYDLTGREVLKQQFSNSLTPNIDIGSLKSGMYLLKAKTRQGVITAKIMKQKAN